MSKGKKDHQNSHRGGNGAEPQDFPAHEATPAAAEEPAQGAEGAAGAASEPDSELERLRTQLADKDREIAELKDRYLRTIAETDNTRKRIRQQSEESIRLQRENLLRDILPIVDNLERAVGAARGGGNGKSIIEGVEMVLGSLMDFLRVQGVAPVEAVGHPFDPRLHEAVDSVESEHHEPNTVIEEFHRGYTAGDRILRPARVSVAKGKAETEGNRGE